jgi:hypothetical protein
VLGACASARQSTPDEVLATYSRALAEGRVREAYELLSLDAKKNMSFETFQRIVKENPQEMREIASALVRPTSSTTVTATVTGPDGKALLLHLEDGKWRVDRSAVELYGQDTPEAALRSFLRALEGRRYDVLLRFVPDAKKEGLDAAKLKAAFEGEQRDEVQRVSAGVAAALSLQTAAIENLGERATLSYGAGGTVELVREHGVWKIEDF